jgi:hypothetical protein
MEFERWSTSLSRAKTLSRVAASEIAIVLAQDEAISTPSAENNNTAEERTTEAALWASTLPRYRTCLDKINIIFSCRLFSRWLRSEDNIFAGRLDLDLGEILG